MRAIRGSACIRYSLYTVENSALVGVENSHTTNRPPGRVTRAISRNPAEWSTTLRSPKLIVTASNTPSAKGSRVASPATFGTLRPAPAASMPTEKSAATHQAPEAANSSVDTAVPAARSRTLSPGPIFSAARVARRQKRSWPSESTVLVRS